MNWEKEAKEISDDIRKFTRNLLEKHATKGGIKIIIITLIDVLCSLIVYHNTKIVKPNYKDNEESAERFSEEIKRMIIEKYQQTFKEI